MVAFLHNDDELAVLLGHEICHILSRQNAILVTRKFHDILGMGSVTDKKDIAEKYNRLQDNFARDRGLAQNANPAPAIPLPCMIIIIVN